MTAAWAGKFAHVRPSSSGEMRPAGLGQKPPFYPELPGRLVPAYSVEKLRPASVAEIHEEFRLILRASGGAD